MARNEVQDTVMGAAEAIACQRCVRLAGEVAVGEEEQFDQRADEVAAAVIAAVGAAGSLAALPTRRAVMSGF